MTLREYVGQDEAKRKINFYLDAYKVGQPMPNFLFAGSKGAGKTSLAEALGLEVKRISEEKVKVLCLNCASLKNMNAFWNSVVMPHINNRDVYLIFDEVHKMPTDILTAFLTIINPNPHSKTSYTHDDYTVDFDLRRQTFVFCTTDVQQLPLSFVNRGRRLSLVDYTDADLAKIIKMNTPETHFKNEVLSYIAPTLRSNARTAALMSKDIRTYLAPLARKDFGLDDWTSLSRTLDILPMGLTRLELNLLKTLQERGETSLTALASIMGFSPSALRTDLELFLINRNLIRIGIASKRCITSIGQSYLSNRA